MTDLTPLQILDDAVHAFATAIGTEGTVSAWVIAFEHVRVIGEPGIQPLADTQDYALGPGTSTATAAGLAASIAQLARMHVVEAMRGRGDDEG